MSVFEIIMLLIVPVGATLIGLLIRFELLSNVLWFGPRDPDVDTDPEEAEWFRYANRRCGRMMLTLGLVELLITTVLIYLFGISLRGSVLSVFFCIAQIVFLLITLLVIDDRVRG